MKKIKNNAKTKTHTLQLSKDFPMPIPYLNNCRKQNDFSKIVFK